MKGSKSKKNILAEFYHSDSKITVISFDKTGKRELTYSGLNVFSALEEITKKVARGFVIKVFINLPSVGFGLEREIEEYNSKKYEPFYYQV